MNTKFHENPSRLVGGLELFHMERRTEIHGEDNALYFFFLFAGFGNTADTLWFRPLVVLKCFVEFDQCVITLRSTVAINMFSLFQVRSCRPFAVGACKLPSHNYYAVQRRQKRTIFVKPAFCFYRGHGKYRRFPFHHIPCIPFEPYSHSVHTLVDVCNRVITSQRRAVLGWFIGKYGSEQKGRS
jgi:hypothetical protein